MTAEFLRSENGVVPYVCETGVCGRESDGACDGNYAWNAPEWFEDFQKRLIHAAAERIFDDVETEIPVSSVRECLVASYGFVRKEG